MRLLPLVLAIALFDLSGAASSPLRLRIDRKPAAEAPLPPRRPIELTPPPKPEARPAPQTPETRPQAEVPAPDPACARAMASGRLVATLVAPVHGAEPCGIASPIRLHAIVLADGARIPMEPEALIRCDLAEALGDWVRDDIVPLTKSVGGGLAKILGSDGYECRGRNRVLGAIISEHGMGNALDMSGFVLHDGRTLLIERANQELDLMTQIRDSGCARFNTVLGPGSDGYHEAHMHVDLKARTHGYRICQWDME
jgi:hypothetical protein